MEIQIVDYPILREILNIIYDNRYFKLMDQYSFNKSWDKRMFLKLQDVKDDSY